MIEKGCAPDRSVCDCLVSGIFSWCAAVARLASGLPAEFELHTLSWPARVSASLVHLANPRMRPREAGSSLSAASGSGATPSFWTRLGHCGRLRDSATLALQAGLEDAMLLRDTAVGLLALLATPVFANEPPRFNIEATCRAAQPLGPEDRAPYDGCVRDENEARSQLVEQWARYTDQHRQTCAAETSLGAYPSYVEVLTCLQMYSGGPTPSLRPRLRRGT
jgi:hypothetical protein